MIALSGPATGLGNVGESILERLTGADIEPRAAVRACWPGMVAF